MVRRMCKRCGEEIPAERLEALPETWLCVKCSQEVGGEFDPLRSDDQAEVGGEPIERRQAEREQEHAVDDDQVRVGAEDPAVWDELPLSRR